MSIRTVGSRLFKHAHSIVRNICRRDYSHNITNIAEAINVVQEVKSVSGPISSSTRRFALRNIGLQFSIHAKRIFIDNVLNRVTNDLASELRKQAARRFFLGDSRPFLAFVAVSLASGTGILTKEEEMEGVCWEIRVAMSKLKYNDGAVTNIEFETDNVSLDQLEFGKPIAKGSNAVVYEANLKDSPKNDIHMLEEDSYLKYPLAVKMMFNYDIQSNALAILQAMYRETVPARQYANEVASNGCELDLMTRRMLLPPHPNIVTMYSVFTDYIPDLSNNRGLYPAALPHRIFSEGEGRNMSLFLVMKRYHCTLKEYISNGTHSQRAAMLLFAQLLEGILHLNSHGIAHRDLKSDNLLVDTSHNSTPTLVITDFGCCLADKSSGLLLHYNVYDIEKGGNAALMAPEIITQRPGAFRILNYSKSDLWTAGTLAYEIFDGYNPFYNSTNGKKLRNIDFEEEDLPALSCNVSPVIQKLVKNILQRNPNKRVDPELAANIMQVFLWAPTAWFKTLPSSGEILQWLLCMATKVYCEGRLPGIFNQRKGERSTSPEYLLIVSFLRRAKLSSIRNAIAFLHRN